MRVLQKIASLSTFVFVAVSMFHIGRAGDIQMELRIRYDTIRGPFNTETTNDECVTVGDENAICEAASLPLRPSHRLQPHAIADPEDNEGCPRVRDTFLIEDLWL